jgi:hypothetical protein
VACFTGLTAGVFAASRTSHLQRDRFEDSEDGSMMTNRAASLSGTAGHRDVKLFADRPGEAVVDLAMSRYDRAPSGRADPAGVIAALVDLSRTLALRCCSIWRRFTKP